MHVLEQISLMMHLITSRLKIFFSWDFLHARLKSPHGAWMELQEKEAQKC